MNTNNQSLVLLGKTFKKSVLKLHEQKLAISEQKVGLEYVLYLDSKIEIWNCNEFYDCLEGYDFTISPNGKEVIYVSSYEEAVKVKNYIYG